MSVEGLITPVVMDVFRNWIWDLISSLYNWVDIYFNFILEIGAINIFDDAFIAGITDKIYIFVGVFMVMKMSLFLIKYLANPNSPGFNSSKDGVATKMIFRILMVVLLIASAPTMFAFLKTAQTAILITLPDIFTPEGTDSSIKPIEMETSCEYFINYQGKGYKEIISSKDGKCSQNIILDSTKVAYLTNVSTAPKYNYTNAISKTINETFMGVNYSLWSDGYIDDGQKSIYIDAITTADYDTLTIYIDKRVTVTGDVISDSTSEKQYTKDVYELKFDWISALLFTIVSFAMVAIAMIQITIRSVKLAFLEILAPIPIISYLDPNADWNDGISVPSKYLKAYFATYLDIFIRITVVIVVMTTVHTVDDLSLFQVTGIVKLLLLESLLAALIIIPKMLGNTFMKDGVKILDAVSIKDFGSGSSVSTTPSGGGMGRPGLGGGSGATGSGGSLGDSSSLAAIGSQIMSEAANANKSKDLSNALDAGGYSDGAVGGNTLTSSKGLRTNASFDTNSTQAKSEVSFSNAGSGSGGGSAGGSDGGSTINNVTNVTNSGVDGGRGGGDSDRYSNDGEPSGYSSRGDAQNVKPSSGNRSGGSLFSKTVNNNYNTTNNYSGDKKTGGKYVATDKK